jgi:aspartyl protease family protein
MQATKPTSNPDPSSRLGRHFAWIAWLLLLGLLYLFFQDELEPNRVPDSQVQADGSRIVILDADLQGHFGGTLLINGQPARFLLDTGATSVAVSSQLAKRLQLPKGQAYQTATANGIATVYRSQIAELRLGDIVLYQIEASIVPDLAGSEILLGMSALKQLEFAKSQQQLQLIQRP